MAERFRPRAWRLPSGESEPLGTDPANSPENYEFCSTMRIKRRMVGELGQNEPGANLACQAGGPRDAEVAGASPARAGGPLLQIVAGSRPQTTATVFLGGGGLFQEGLTSILGDTDFRIVAAARKAEEITLTLSQDQRLLLIVDAGDDLSFAAGEIERFKGRFPAARVAVLTDADQIRNLLTLFRAGAHACFARGVTRDVLLKSLELVVLGETFLLPGVLPLVPDARESAAATAPAPNKGTTLSAQEKCVLRCLAEGHSNKVIANKIDIAVATVKVHVNSIFRKIGTSNRTQAAIWARTNIPQEEPAENRAILPAPALAPAAPLEDKGATEAAATVSPPAAAPRRLCELHAGPALKERPGRPASVERGACGSKQEGKTGVRRQSFDEELDRRAQRRLAEEEERHAEFVARTNHLRELRKAREDAERKTADCASAKLSAVPDEIPALMPLKTSSASPDERGSQHPGIGLA
jgi:two-component system nitrate/nitrite response regulator NarL